MVDSLKTEDIVHPQCQFLVERKKRLCRMLVRPGQNYCCEHEPQNKQKQEDTRVPCPYDPKHTCYASKLKKHLSICNARQTEQPAYIVHNINSPLDDAGGGEGETRRSLGEVPREELLRVIDKINYLYEKHVAGHIEALPERPVHAAVAAEFADAGRAEGSRRHLRQASALLHLVEQHGLVQPGTCYVELGAGKGRLAYYAGVAWCGGAGGGGAGGGAGSRVLPVDRAALRHKRDNKLAGAATRLRADLAHLALERVPAVEASRHVVGFAKHLCGVATDFALRCVAAPGALAKTRGVVLATCCHHRCERAPFVGTPHLQELGVSAEELRVMLGVVSWATSGAGAGAGAAGAEAGRRAKALLDWARARWLAGRGFAARLLRFVPDAVSPENVCIVATRPRPRPARGREGANETLSMQI
ncbi:tRNA:m(4)X modification enzyme TRM13 homolog [Hyposmocoma kahamanoa]|uniref:tRNA:m(4)X modification enzyme TRM13 homolog n=1 Tax=Hyposmocoma kahamanoa TaxID=1477025 RepID=UPI000E6D66DB|nr:tRNA:m(4)X modification enzyme TRM13 homolog [Hyposmocoma kahamanoa]